MKVSEFIEKLQQVDPELEIWIDDNGDSEGGRKLLDISIEPAYNAGLDGDDIDDEYEYIDDIEDINTDQIRLDGYILYEDDNVISKNILLIKW